MRNEELGIRNVGIAFGDGIIFFERSEHRHSSILIPNS